MFQFSGYSYLYLCIQYRLLEYCSNGFPHSDICGSMLICSSPQLFAAYHVLRRLLMPRHSPCALLRLTSSKLTPYQWASSVLQSKTISRSPQRLIMWVSLLILLKNSYSQLPFVHFFPMYARSFWKNLTVFSLEYFFFLLTLLFIQFSNNNQPTFVMVEK